VECTFKSTPLLRQALSFLTVLEARRNLPSASCGIFASLRWPLWVTLWNQFHNMQVIQIVLDKKLLHAADQAAKRTQRNRSALMRDALREHLRRLALQAKEERDRQGYSGHPPAEAEAEGWESEAAWPEE
jgi:hypothetical protein